MPQRFAPAMFCMLFLCLASSPVAYGRESEKLSGAALYDLARQSSVTIIVDGRVNGSGWFASPDGLIMTAHHVVWGSTTRIEIVSPTVSRRTVRLLAFDRGHDVALLTVPRGSQPYAFLPLAPREPQPLEQIYLFGQPSFGHDHLLAGTVATAVPTFDYRPNEMTYIRVYHVVGAAPKGTSGGCWLDAEGRVVGVQSGYMVTGEKAPEGVASISPLEAVERLLRAKTSADTAYIGAVIEELPTQPSGYIARFPVGTGGLAVYKLNKDSAGEKGGLVHDMVITAMDDQPIEMRDDFLEKLMHKKVGQEITLRVLSPDVKTPRDVKVKLARLEDITKAKTIAATTSSPVATKPQQDDRVKALEARVRQLEDRIKALETKPQEAKTADTK